ncbi:MAG: hypothetical protein Q7S74_03685 [Nanoarchaeota archaeon]|nr:hypothetical protein [Nanoarchaeota archaeon]
MVEINPDEMEEETDEELERFEKIEKIGISISVNKKNLEKLKEHMEKNDPEAPLSLPFDVWLEVFVERLKKYEEREKKKEKGQTKKEGEENK